MKHFGGFTLDTTNHCLWRGDHRVTLAPKAFDLLRYLVERADRLVSHDEILDALWADTHVNPEVVKKHILEIRKVFGDRRDQPQFIRTVPKRGYQFVAPVSDDRQAPADSPATIGSVPLVDRRAARARVEACLTPVTRGSRRVVFVTGEAGVGKTTFVDAFVGRARRLSDVRVARGQCIEGFGGQEAYYPVLEGVDQLVRSNEARSLDLLRTRAPTWLQQFPGLVKAGDRDALGRETFGATRERMVREVCELVEAIAADRPLVLVLEDLHWADPATLDVVSTFARRREPARVLLVVTARPPAGASNTAVSRLRQDLEMRGLCEQIALEPFAPAEVAEYVALEFEGADFTADLAALIHRHSGGNALFVSALVRDFAANGFIVREAGRWRLSAPIVRIEPRVPESLQDMIDVQFDALPPAEQQALKAASVVGERFPAGLVAADREGIAEVEQACELLAERRVFIRPAGIAELADGTISAQYEFRHALYRQAIYRRLSEVARARLHRTAADRLEALHGPGASGAAAEIAVHCERAHEHERAVRYLVLAAGHAAHRFAVRDSLEVLQHAIGLVPNLAPARRPPLEIAILEQIGDAHYALGAMHESARAYQDACAIATRAGLVAARVQMLGCLARALGLLDPDRAIAVLTDAARASGALGEPVIHARTELLAAGTRLFYGRWDAEDVATCDRAAGRLGRSGRADAAGFDQMIYAHVQALRGDVEGAFATARAGVPDSSGTAGVMVHLFALSAQILALLHGGRFADALGVIRESRQLAEKNGSDPWLFQYREAWLRLLALDFAGARRVCNDLVRSSVYPTGQAQAIHDLAAGFDALDRGRVDEARRSFEIVVDERRTPRFFLHWYWRLYARVGLTRTWLAAGDLAGAGREARQLTDVEHETAEPNLRALMWEARAQVAIADSDWDDARESIGRALGALKGMAAARADWQVHLTASALSRAIGEIDAALWHHARARDLVVALVDSLPIGEPLRNALSSAPAVRRVWEDLPVER